ncbi:MAG: 3-keto-5-aminohexanoate cleavage protein [Deltaproteobacteria bacterium]|nr:3-keto-5-aminohexanoate cleavage protein [Deltaproteobacteria bacterium]
MTDTQHEDKLARYKDMKGYYSTPPETIFAAKKTWVEQRRWDIPEEFVIKVAPVGAFIMKEDNPNQRYAPDEIVKDIEESIEAGACAFHTHVRDSQGRHTLDVSLYHEVIDPIKSKYGHDVIVCGCPEGGNTIAESLRPILEFQDIIEVAPITVTAVNLAGDFSVVMTSEIVRTHVEFMQEVGCKPEMVLHNLGDLSLVKRWLIDTGVAKKPYYFRIAMGNPGWGYIEDPDSMFQCLTFVVRELKKIDPNCAVMIDMAGRAGLFSVATAISLGLMGARVGMEDALYMYPHKDEVIKSNVSVVKHAVALVEAMGRKVATAEDYRRYVGIDARKK